MTQVSVGRLNNWQHKSIKAIWVRQPSPEQAYKEPTNGCIQRTALVQSHRLQTPIMEHHFSLMIIKNDLIKTRHIHYTHI